MTEISIEPREPGSVLVLAGDGIGSEVMGAALRVLNWFNANRGCRFSIVSDSIGGACHDLAGRGIVNPMGAILCVAMMFEHSFGMPRERGMIEEAVAEVARAGIVTPDVGGGASTAIVTSAVMDALSDFG